MSELTERQKKFCRELLKGKNQTQAAIDAGYSKNGAKVTASQLLTHPNVKAYLAELSKKVESSAIMTGSEVLQMLTKIAIKAPRSGDCLRALDLLGKHHKLFTEMHEHQHNFTVMPTITRGGKPVDINVGKPKPLK